MIGGVADHELDRIIGFVALHDAAHDILQDVGALAVEPEDLRVRRLGHIRAQSREVERALGEKTHRERRQHTAASVAVPGPLKGF